MHDKVIKWKYFPRYCVGNSPVTGEFPSQRPVTRIFDFFFICAWTNSWANNGDSEDLRHHRAHYGVTVMGFCLNFGVWLVPYLTHIVYFVLSHYTDVIMSSIASQITSLTIVYSAVYSGADQRKHHSSASLVFVLGIHRGPVNSPHKRPVTRKMFPFDDVIMAWPCVYDMDTLYVLLQLRGIYCSTVRAITKSSSTFSATNISSNITSILRLHATIQINLIFATKFSSIYLAKGEKRLVFRPSFVNLQRAKDGTHVFDAK